MNLTRVVTAGEVFRVCAGDPQGVHRVALRAFEVEVTVPEMTILLHVADLRFHWPAPLY